MSQQMQKQRREVKGPLSIPSFALVFLTLVTIYVSPVSSSQEIDQRINGHQGKLKCDLPSSIENQKPLEFFSYYASAMDGVGYGQNSGNYTKAISDHSNLTWIASDHPSTVKEKLEEARDLGMRAVIDLQSIFFGKDFIPKHSSLHSSTNPDQTEIDVGDLNLYKAEFKKLVTDQLLEDLLVSSKSQKSPILSFVLLDEPYSNGSTDRIGARKKRSSKNPSSSHEKKPRDLRPPHKVNS